MEPINFGTPLEDVELEEVGLEAVFFCEVTKAGMKAEWFCKEKPITANKKYEISASNGKHTLTVKDAQPEDEVTYTIKIKDTKSSAELTIKGIFPFPFLAH